ncbi:hypothetical protein TSAR_001369 [Trichomalopsis sarcophagae]|uniref:Choline transporter-like protein n=1 Tax=Trichomalopsis sarcophagae TaxID=543379 RepID=A0A232EG50_9HYME|nr:hypothetical protein TSAR_001369 [Trichomalopsis sarcophagae]
MSGNKDKYGEKIAYDPLWKGPMATIRYTTDWIWLIVFVLYLLIFFSIGIFSFSAGSLNRYIVPTDSHNRACGVDADVINKPYLFVLNPKECLNALLEDCHSPKICVPKCPTENFILDPSLTIEQVKAKLICDSDVNTTLIKTFDQIEQLVALERCAKWYLESDHLYKYCLPTKVWEGHQNETLNAQQLNQTRIMIQALKSVWAEFRENTSIAIKPAIIAIICGTAITLLFVVLLRRFAVQFFYSSIGIFIVALGACVYWFSTKYAQKQGQTELFFLIFFVLMIVGIIIAVIYFRKKIYLACLLIKESSKAVLHMSTTLVFPILPILLYTLVIVYCALVCLSAQSIVKSDYRIDVPYLNKQLENCVCEADSFKLIANEPCDPIKFNNKCKTSNGDPCLFTQCRLDNKTSPGYVYALQAVNGLVFYWLMFFISGFEYMVLGGTFASWYWTLNKNNVGNYALIESTSKTLRYHLGTVAIGSLILTILQIIRRFLESLKKEADKSENGVAQVARLCFQCLFALLESFLNFLSYNAYIMCAIHGKSFFRSAKMAFNLIMRNIIKIVIVDNVASLLFFIAEVLITLLATGGLYMFYHNAESTEQGPMVLALVITAVGTLIIATVMFKVQTIAVKTIFLCFVEDTERNDGSEERPYYMSNKLKKLLQK